MTPDAWKRISQLCHPALTRDVERLLAQLGLPTEVPSPRPARAPPLDAGTSHHVGRDEGAFPSC